MLRYKIKHVRHIQMLRNDINKLFNAIPQRHMHYPLRGPGKSGQEIKHLDPYLLGSNNMHNRYNIHNI